MFRLDRSPADATTMTDWLIEQLREKNTPRK